MLRQRIVERHYYPGYTIYVYEDEDLNLYAVLIAHVDGREVDQGGSHSTAAGAIDEIHKKWNLGPELTE